jgi:hypothetical protein
MICLAGRRICSYQRSHLQYPYITKQEFRLRTGRSYRAYLEGQYWEPEYVETVYKARKLVRESDFLIHNER